MSGELSTKSRECRNPFDQVKQCSRVVGGSAWETAALQQVTRLFIREIVLPWPGEGFTVEELSNLSRLEFLAIGGDRCSAKTLTFGPKPKPVSLVLPTADSWRWFAGRWAPQANVLTVSPCRFEFFPANPPLSVASLTPMVTWFEDLFHLLANRALKTEFPGTIRISREAAGWLLASGIHTKVFDFFANRSKWERWDAPGSGSFRAETNAAFGCPLREQEARQVDCLGFFSRVCRHLMSISTNLSDGTGLAHA